MKPGSKRTANAKPGHGGVGVEEAILHDIVGEIAIACQQISQAERVRLMPTDALRKPLDVAALTARDRILITAHMDIVILPSRL